MTQTKSGHCPICKLQGLESSLRDAGEKISTDCPRCGTFTITRTATSMMGKRNIGSKLSAWIRDHAEAKRDPPEIHSGNIDAIESTLPDYTVAQKQLLLLRAIARRSDFPGKTVRLIPDHDFPLAWATNDTELHYYLQTTAVRTRIAPCTCSLTARLARWTVDGMSYSQWLRVSTQVFQRAFITWFERKRANNRFDPDLRTTRFVRWSPGQPDALGSTKRMIDNED